MGAYLPTVLTALSPLLLALLGYVAKKLADLIDAHVSNAALNGFLNRLDNATYTVVKEIMQTVISGMKDSPGGLPADVAAKAKADAVAKVKAYLGADGLKLLGQVLGVVPEQADAFISSKVEAAVHDVKTESALASDPNAAAAALKP